MTPTSTEQWRHQFPLINTLSAYQETHWFNPAALCPVNEGLAHVGLTASDIR